jgi:hypothetical protein
MPYTEESAGEASIAGGRPAAYTEAGAGTRFRDPGRRRAGKAAPCGPAQSLRKAQSRKFEGCKYV